MNREPRLRSGTAPVVLFVYNRPAHTKATLEALSRNFLAGDTDLFIFCDGPRSDADREAVAAVRDVVAGVEGFRNVSVEARESNLGLASSIIRGVTEVVEARGRVIVIEDDLVTHPATLTYFNRMLDHLEDNSGVFSISGYSLPPSLMPIPDDYPYDVYAIPRMQCWGWATWKDRWAKADFELPNFAAFDSSPAATAAYAYSIGADSLRTLRACVRGEKDVWACRWVYAHFKHHAVCICPTRSLIDNIGLDGSGNNCGVSEDFQNDVRALDVSDWRLPDAAFVDPRIFEAFMAVMDPSRVRPVAGISYTVRADAGARPSFARRAAYWALRPRQLVRRIAEKGRALSPGRGSSGGPRTQASQASSVEARHQTLSAAPSRPLVRLGTEYGGWWVPESGLGPDDVVISAGAGEDISFDVELAKRFGCRIFLIDPTPRACAHFDATRESITAGLPAPINHSDTEFYDVTPQALSRIAFRPYGLWVENTTLRFHAPANPTSVSHSIGNLQNTTDGFDAACLTLDEILRREGLSEIAVLKMDIEGAEFDVLERLIVSGMRPKYLLVEFHPGQDETERTERPRTLAALKNLHDAGYRLIRYRGWDYVLEHEPSARV